MSNPLNRCASKSKFCRLCPSWDQGVFSNLSDKELEFMEYYKTSHQYKKKQIIFYEGNPVLGFYCIRSGKVKVYKSGDDGKQQILRIHQAGDAIGYAPLFSQESHSTTAEVIEDAEVCFLSKQEFISIVQRNSAVALNLISRVSKELSLAEEKAFKLAYQSVRARFSGLLLALKDAFGIQKDGACLLNIALSREEMAQAIGTTVETTVRLLSEFRKEKLIRVQDKNIFILAPEQLVELTKSGH